MFDCDVRLDITLSEKRSASASVDFKVSVGIKLAGGEDGGNWRQLGTPDPRIPLEGLWVYVPPSAEFGHRGVVLKSGKSQPFAYMKWMLLPPQVGATGDLMVFSPGQREYASPNLAWRGHGNFEVLARQANLPYPEAPWTLTLVKRNIWDNVGTFLGWQLTTTRGFSLAAGAGGRGIEFLHGILFMKKQSKKAGEADEERSFNYTGTGGGFMFPGGGGSYADSDWPSIGSYLTKGNMPVSEPFRLEDLEGMCHIVDLNFGGIMPTPTPGSPLPGGLGVAGNALGFIFGVPGGLALGGFKACGWVAGPAALAGKSGISGGATLNIGKITLQR